MLPTIATAQKLKPQGEDRHSTKHLVENKFLYTGIFDGHNGSLAAEICSKSFPEMLNSIYNYPLPLNERLVDIFKHLNDSIPDDSGTTASIVIVSKNYVCTAHVGDTKVVLCTKNSSVELTNDHKLSLETERKRIRMAEIQLNQTMIFGNRVEGLMITRSIGDKQLSEEIIPHPFITEFKVSMNDRYIVLASDGLWDVCKPEEVYNLIKLHNLELPTEISQMLCYYAEQQYQRLMRKPDDITCTVIDLHPKSMDTSDMSIEDIMRK